MGNSFETPTVNNIVARNKTGQCINTPNESFEEIYTEKNNTEIKNKRARERKLTTKKPIKKIEKKRKTTKAKPKSNATQTSRKSLRGIKGSPLLDNNKETEVIPADSFTRTLQSNGCSVIPSVEREPDKMKHCVKKFRLNRNPRMQRQCDTSSSEIPSSYCGTPSNLFTSRKPLPNGKFRTEWKREEKRLQIEYHKAEKEIKSSQRDELRAKAAAQSWREKLKRLTAEHRKHLFKQAQSLHSRLHDAERLLSFHEEYAQRLQAKNDHMKELINSVKEEAKNLRIESEKRRETTHKILDEKFLTVEKRLMKLKQKLGQTKQPEKFFLKTPKANRITPFLISDGPEKPSQSNKNINQVYDRPYINYSRYLNHAAAHNDKKKNSSHRYVHDANFFPDHHVPMNPVAFPYHTSSDQLAYRNILKSKSPSDSRCKFNTPIDVCGNCLPHGNGTPGIISGIQEPISPISGNIFRRGEPKAEEYSRPVLFQPTFPVSCKPGSNCSRLIENDRVFSRNTNGEQHPPDLHSTNHKNLPKQLKDLQYKCSRTSEKLLCSSHKARFTTQTKENRCSSSKASSGSKAENRLSSAGSSILVRLFQKSGSETEPSSPKSIHLINNQKKLTVPRNLKQPP